MSNRKFISQDELLKWINNKIQEHEECENIFLQGICLLAEEDPEGNNWSASSFRVTGVSEEIYMTVLEKVISEAKKLFNIKE